MRGLGGVWSPLNLDGSPEDGPSTQVVWRPLSWKEYRRFEGKTPLPAADIYETCLVEGPTLDQVPAGICHWIASREMESSPFSGQFPDLRKAIDRSRARVQSSYLLSARALVAGVFRYSFEQIDEWPAEVFFERLAQAELMAKAPLEPADPKAAPAKPNPARRPLPRR